MSRRYAYFFLIIILVVSLSAASAYVLKIGQQPTNPISTLTFYTEQFPPCNYQENGTVKGIAVDLLTEITDKLGSKVSADQVQIVPWTDAYQATLTGENSVLFSTARLPAREQSFKWAGPLFMDTYALFTRWNNEVTITDASDLNGYKIGVIKDSAAITQLTNAGVNESYLVYFTNASAIIENLSGGEIDFWCYAQVVGRTLTEQITGNYYSFKNAFQLSYYEYYYAFSKDVPDSTVNSFQQAIDALKQEKDTSGISTYEQILARYIPTQGTATTPEELVEFVQSAYKYAQQNNQEVALNEFNNQTGQFVEGELYIFAYDMTGNTLALPFQPEIIGTNRWNATDANGTAFIQQIIQTAQSGGGFVRYSYLDPADNFAVKPKVSYVLMAGQDWLIGAGIYEAQR
ncbi:MAG: cache domain-containing protein [Candidatus Bathyarchaeota archaeon]|nr:cache domain-containing protein [Candidatus Bathyarchaeota archaeon]